MKTLNTIPITQRQRDLEPLGDLLSISGRLQLLGWRSVAAWAKAHDFDPITTRVVIYRWGLKSDEPRGGLSRMIMRELRATIEEGRRAA